MVAWVNRAVFQAPRNGSASHTIDPSSTTGLVSGAAFTPTAGRLLVVVVEGAVTSSTPSGWTLPSGGSAISESGLYVWYRTAAGGDTFTTTHNAPNYPVVFAVYEFPAGSTFVKSVAATSVSNTAANPNLTGLSGTNVIFGVKGTVMASPWTYGGAVWSSGYVEDYDDFVPYSGTDGYWLTIAAQEGITTSSAQPTATISGTAFGAEALTFAVKVPAGGSSYPASGSSAAISTASASARLRARAGGTAVAVSAAMAAAAALLGAGGVAAAVSAATAGVVKTSPASGESAAQSGASGTATSKLVASGSTPASSSAFGSADTDADTSGVASATSGTSGAATLLARAQGAAVASSTTSGDARASASAAGIAEANSTSYGSASTPGGVGGLAVVTSTAEGSATMSAEVAGMADAHSHAWGSAGGRVSNDCHPSLSLVAVSPRITLISTAGLDLVTTAGLGLVECS